MIKTFATSFLAAALVALALPASAATVDYGSYSVTFDDATSFGGISFNSTGGGGSVGFGWNFAPAALAEASATGGTDSHTLALPGFTITANSGYALSGALVSSFGVLSYTEFGASSTTSVSGSGSLSVDGGPAAASISAPLTRTTITPFTGYYSASPSAPVGAFSSLAFSGSILASATTGAGGYASIVALPGSTFSVSFTALAVPEPEGYMMMTAGLFMIGAIVRRRSRRG